MSDSKDELEKLLKLEVSPEEKIELFKKAEELRSEFSKDKIISIFEKTKEILTPFVAFLGDRIPSRDDTFLKLIKESNNFIGLDLLSSGIWRLNYYLQNRDTHNTSSSDALVKFLFYHKVDLFNFCFKGRSEEIEYIIEELPFLENLIFYVCVMELLSLCKKRIADILLQKEKELEEMCKRLVCFSDFSNLLNPLGHGRKTLQIPSFSIFFHDTSSSRDSASYFNKSELTKFIDYISKNYENPDMFKIEDHSTNVESIFTVINSIFSQISDILKTKKENIKISEIISENRQKRLPFSDDEIKFLQTIPEKVFD